MQFIALIYSAPGQEPEYGTPAFARMMEGYNTLTQTLKDANAFIAGDALEAAHTATSVRVRGGKTETMDGPFAETKEHLGGYYLMEVPDLDTALRYAAMIPTAAYGTVEVRPVMVY
jgi:hypothetical protein